VRFYPVGCIWLSLLAGSLPAADLYTLGPDSAVQAVPHGEVRTGTFAASTIFPGSTRDYIVYVPKQYDPKKSACLMVFFDGINLMKVDGSLRVPVVFDNLIAKKAMPVTMPWR